VADEKGYFAAEVQATDGQQAIAFQVR
jgi:hypothetical protein